MAIINRIVLLVCVTVLCFVMGTNTISMRNPETSGITVEQRI